MPAGAKCCLVCNIQDYIYPGLKLLRRLCLPIISLFPSLTEYYQETCLVQNPFFTVVDMDCWPCSTVYDVKEIYDPKPITEQQNAPFIYETDQRLISLDMLQDLYLKHKEVLEREVPKILINNKYYLYPKDLFELWRHEEKTLSIWKFNTINEAKLLRQIISRPKIVPKFGQSTERFIIIDSSQESFKIPDTECSFSFLLSLNGSRTVNLIPADECKHQCKSLQVELKETYLLWYNWWYWRPRIQSTTRNGTFIAHIGSYC
ncbi:hypothetical protein K1T71_005186 [Dendrolimus kikuchii]|uniref:Uncharacterized protein n=1 Tax=Dendrolimus kikuchii TaxID=765133 RepID=A0ACC1D6E7_9NEOP|nr:hypothetical protein K1T71_005186 [Dendrolimus kikuchii]